MARSKKNKKQAKTMSTLPVPAGKLGAGFIVLLVIGMAAGALAAPQLFGRRQVGSTSQPKADILGPDGSESLDASSLASPEITTGTPTQVIDPQAVGFDWDSAPTPLQTPAEDIEARIEESKVQAYAYLGKAGSIEFIHASFYPFSEIAPDRYYSALVDLTFVVDPDAAVVSEICQGKAVSSNSTCRSTP